MLGTRHLITARATSLGSTASCVEVVMASP